MTVRTRDGIEIDTESKIYKDYLRAAAIEARSPEVSDPAPYRTMGDIIELQRRQQELEAKNSSVNPEFALSVTVPKV